MLAKYAISESCRVLGPKIRELLKSIDDVKKIGA